MTNIEKIAKTLDITIDEAKSLVADDKQIDKMTSIKDIDNDLTDDQKKALKKARQSDRKPTVYTFEKGRSKKAKKEKPMKKTLIEGFKGVVESLGATDVEIPNEEREMTFTIEGVKYKIILSEPRK